MVLWDNVHIACWGGVSLLCSWLITLTVAKSNVKCPSNFACGCSRLEREGQYVLYIDCKGVLKNGQLPDLSPLKGKPIGHMDFRENNIREIGDDIFDGITFKGIEESLALREPLVCLGSNPLSDISEHAFRGSSANRVNLHITNASLTTFPTLIHHITNLYSLDLRANNIGRIPDNIFQELKQVKVLNVAENPLRVLNKEALHGIEDSLEDIDLAHIGLREFPNDVLKNFKRINTINLSENKIHSLPSDTFHHWQTDADSLHLFLSNNLIRRVASNALLKSPTSNFRIADLHLEHNKISDLDFLYDGCNLIVDRDTHVDLDGNPVNCDCRFYEFAKVGYFREIHGECSKPAKYHQMEFHIDRSRGASGVAGQHEGKFGPVAEKDCPKGNMSAWDVSCLAGYEAIEGSQTSGALSGILSPFIGILLATFLPLYV